MRGGVESGGCFFFLGCLFVWVGEEGMSEAFFIF